MTAFAVAFNPKSSQNRRRSRDLAHSRCQRERILNTQRLIALACIAEGLSIIDAAVQSEISDGTIPTSIRRFREGLHLTVMKQYAAAGIGDQMLKTRWSLYQRAAEIEAKAEELSDHEQAPVTLLFCGNGLAWDVDTLEGFADFYSSGRIHRDDWAANILMRYMVERKIEFKRTLAGFHYLEMKPFEVKP